MADKWLKDELPVDSRQLEMISRYYPVDRKNKTVTFTFHFASVDEILTPDVKTIRPISHVDSSILEKMDSFVSFLPQDYMAVFDFEIDDYKGNNPQEILDSFNDAVELNHYSGLKKSRKQKLVASILMAVGCIVLLLMCVGEIHGWFGEGTRKDMISEIIDIIAWVFIWESVSMAFLEPSSNMSLDVTMKTRILSVRFFDKEKHLLVQENQNNMISLWKGKERNKSLGYRFLLAGSAGFLALGLATIIMGLPKIVKDAQADSLTGILDFFIVLAISVCYFLGGYAGLMIYSGKRKFRKTTTVFFLLSVLALISNFAYAIFKGESTGFLSPSLSTFALVLFVLGMLILNFSGKENDSSR